MKLPQALRSQPLAGLFVVILLFTATVSSQPPRLVFFEHVVRTRLAKNNSSWEFEKFCPVNSDAVARRVLRNYGAMFIASDVISVPPVCLHGGETEVQDYQKALQRKKVDFNGVPVELQARAADALEIVRKEANANGLSITPFDGSIAGGRTYGDTLMLWNSRVFPALEYWIRRGRLPETARDEIARLDPHKKILKILEWESQGIYFSTNRSRSIFTSTAPPGTSQHLALIAFDVVEYWNPIIRSILNRNGWFQTVVDDPGHFTYLGFPEGELPGRGLIAVRKGGHQYWVPNLAPQAGSANPTR